METLLDYVIHRVSLQPSTNSLPPKHTHNLPSNVRQLITHTVILIVMVSFWKDDSTFLYAVIYRSYVSVDVDAIGQPKCRRHLFAIHSSMVIGTNKMIGFR